MSDNRLSKEWVQRNSQKLKKAYSLAVINGYNIKSIDDVIEILKVVDSENANKEYAEVFSKMLQFFSFKAGRTVERRQKVN